MHTNIRYSMRHAYAHVFRRRCMSMHDEHVFICAVPVRPADAGRVVFSERNISVKDIWKASLHIYASVPKFCEGRVYNSVVHTNIRHSMRHAYAHVFRRRCMSMREEYVFANSSIRNADAFDMTLSRGFNVN